MLAAFIFAIVAATVPTPNRSQRAVLIEVMRLALAGDHRDSRIEYSVRRVDARQALASRVIVWAHASPRWTATIGGPATIVDIGRVRYQCLPVDDHPRCAQLATSGVAVTTSADVYFVAVALARRYTIAELANRTIAGEDARCFRLSVIGSGPVITGLGVRLDSCFTDDGLLLYTVVVRSGGSDTRVAVRMQRGLKADDIHALRARYTDGSIPGL